MKIEKITLYHVQLPMKFDFVTAKSSLNVRDSLIVKVEDSLGNTGYGEVVAFTTPFYTAETFALAWKTLKTTYLPLVLAHDFEHPFEIHDLVNAPLPMTIAGLENALCDLYFKRQNKNTIQALFHEDLATEISQGAVLGDMSITQLLKKAEQLVNSGVTRLKIKITPSDSFERTKAVRTAFPNLQLAVDANRSFQVQNRQDVQKLDELGLICIEEPFDFTDFSELSLLSESIQTPLCFDESVQTLSELKQLVQFPRAMLNIKIGRLGGLYQTREAIEFCRKNSIGFWIGSMVESGISKILHIQLAALSGTAMAGDLSGSAHYFEEDLIKPEIVFANAKTQVPTGAGLGVEINERALERWSVEKEIFSI